jgi:hypothetical protein
MEIELKEKMERFFYAYAANFGKLSEGDGIDYYESWLKSPMTNIDAAIKAIERLGRNWNRKSKPKLGQIKSTIEEIAYEEKQESSGNQKYIIPPCDMCGNTGKVWVVIGLIEGKRYFINNSNRGRGSDMQAKEHPCQCPRGIKQNSILFDEQKSLDGYSGIAKMLIIGWKKWFSNESAAMDYADNPANSTREKT